MSEHDTPTPVDDVMPEASPDVPEPDEISPDGVVAFTLPGGTQVTAPQALAEALGWQPTTAARRSRKK